MRAGAWIPAAGVMVAGIVTGCTDLLLNEPATPGPVAITVRASLTGSPSAQSALGSVLEKADKLVATFDPVDGNGGSFSLAVPLTFTGGEARVRLEVELDRESRAYDIVFLVRAADRTLFAERVTGVTLVRGGSTEVAPELRPLAGFVEIEPIPPVTAIGDEIAIQAQAFFATGDPLPGADLFYESLDLEVLEPVHADPQSNLFRATGEGTARVRVTALGGGEVFDPPDGEPAEAGIMVEQLPVELVASPASLELNVDESAELQVTVRDGNGFPVDREISFVSTVPSVVRVTATGPGTARVDGISEGGAQIVASVGGLSLPIPVVVGQTLGTGDVQVTLTWSNSADLDLYVTDPSGETISYFNPTSQSGGQLDVDDVDGFGPENIFWPPGGAPTGEYVVHVNHFSGPAPSSFQVRVRVEGSEQTLSGQVGAGATVEVVRFTVVGSAAGPRRPPTD